MNQFAHNSAYDYLAVLPILFQTFVHTRITGLYWIDTRAGMYNTFCIRLLPILEIRGLPFTELPEMNPLGASPMNATIF